MEDVYNYLIDFGFKREDIDIIVNTYPINKTVSATLLKHIKENCDYLLEFGYTKSQIIKTTKTIPNLFEYSAENIKKKLENLILLGYSKIQVIKMTKVLPSILSLSIENIKQKIKDLLSLGFTREQVIKIKSQAISQKSI